MTNKRIWGFVFLFLFSTTSFSSDWVSAAKRDFERDEYEACIEKSIDHKKDSHVALMLLSFCHLQLAEFNGTSSDKKKFKNYFGQLKDSVNVEDINEIKYFSLQGDKPEVVKNARTLLKAAFKNINNVEEIKYLLPFLEAEDKKTRKLAASSIKKILGIKRKYVSKGGTLRNKDIAVMQDEKVIRSLLENMDISDAFSALVMIEQPVLSYLDEYDGKQAIKLRKKIDRAIEKREKKYPESSWYSAKGVKRKAAIPL